MLTFYYVFLISALSFSAIAAPPFNPDPSEVQLLHNIVYRLENGLWARLGILPEGPTGTIRSWRLCQTFDDLIGFKFNYGTNEQNTGVEKLNTFRLQRRPKLKGVMPGSSKKAYVYSVYRYRVGRPAMPKPYRENVPMDEWQKYLDNTIWGRLPGIVGTSRSGPTDKLNEIIKLQWKAGVPYVIFLNPDMFSGVYSAAQEMYKLDEEEIPNLGKGVETGFPQVDELENEDEHPCSPNR